MYDFSTGGTYDFDENNFRKLNRELLNNLRIAQTSYLKVLKGEPREYDETKCLTTVQKKGYHPIHNHFFMLISDLIILYIIPRRFIALLFCRID